MRLSLVRSLSRVCRLMLDGDFTEEVTYKHGATSSGHLIAWPLLIRIRQFQPLSLQDVPLYSLHHGSRQYAFGVIVW